MDGQEIRDWSVAGDDRIVGTVHNCAGHADGETIITSPVVQVRFMGERQAPMAFTESGSGYLLGAPARRFGAERAQAFVRRLSTSPRPAHAPRRDWGAQSTVVHRAPEASVAPARLMCGPSLNVTCARCGAVAVATLAEEIHSVNAGAGIRIDDPCLQCAGVLSAPPGRYALNEATDTLERVGAFSTDVPPGVQRKGPEPHDAPGRRQGRPGTGTARTP